MTCAYAASLRHAYDATFVGKGMTPGQSKPTLAASTSDGEADVKLEFCVACGSKDDLLHGHLLKGGGDAEANRITLCASCHDKLHQQRYGARKHSQRIKTALAARLARGVRVGRPKKLMPDESNEVLRRLEAGESKAAVAQSYRLSKATVSRMVRSARLSDGLIEAGSATPR
jgi:hypothetical protein